MSGTARGALEETGRQAFDVILLDNHLPDGLGLGIYDQLVRQNPEVAIIVITGEPELADAVELTRNGLFDYLTKPLGQDELTACLRRAKLRLRSRHTPTSREEIFGNTPLMREVLNNLRQAARHPQAAVLLTGESGVGKDVAARVLHQLTFENLPSKPEMVALNCAAVPGEMFEAELFGSEKGAYTGSDKRREGLVEAARNGTLFLDEITEVSLTLQAKLLRFLDSREYRALGSTTVRQFQGRVVAATNKSLQNEVDAGRFREDLMFRLDVFSIEIPPLRSRLDDIAGLSELLLRQIAQKYGRPVPLIRPQGLAALKGYRFPGNVRELRNLLERSFLKTPEDNPWLAIDLAWLSRPSAKSPHPTADSEAPVRDLSPIEAQEYALIRRALQEANGGIRRAASAAGLTPQSLLRRLQKWPELRKLAGGSEPGDDLSPE